MTTLKIALDWTPNINHIGFFIAQELGFYQENGIQLKIINPLDDLYELTPGKKLELDITDFAIAPFETVISLNNKKNKVDAIAVFAILQEDISSIASLKSNNLTSPKLLDDKIYASYKARYEDKIVKELVKSDGGSGNIKITYPDKLGIWNTLIDGEADATWIFDNWEGVEAKGKNIELNTWKLKDSGIPYGYSPVIIAKKTNLTKFKTEYANFVKATQKGFLYASKHEAEAVTILKKHLSEADRININISEALKVTKMHFGNIETCGSMNSERVSLFLDWLIEKQLEDAKILNQHLFTNELL